DGSSRSHPVRGYRARAGRLEADRATRARPATTGRGSWGAIRLPDVPFAPRVARRRHRVCENGRIATIPRPATEAPPSRGAVWSWAGARASRHGAAPPRMRDAPPTRPDLQRHVPARIPRPQLVQDPVALLEPLLLRG